MHLDSALALALLKHGINISKYGREVPFFSDNALTITVTHLNNIDT